MDIQKFQWAHSLYQVMALSSHYQTPSGRTVKQTDRMKEYLRTQKLGEGESTTLSQKDIEREIKRTEHDISVRGGGQCN